ncbi:hypothetical protein THAOC_07700, partial [Thalassiosira oceanica]
EEGGGEEGGGPDQQGPRRRRRVEPDRRARAGGVRRGSGAPENRGQGRCAVGEPRLGGGAPAVALHEVDSELPVGGSEVKGTEEHGQEQRPFDSVDELRSYIPRSTGKPTLAAPGSKLGVFIGVPPRRAEPEEPVRAGRRRGRLGRRPPPQRRTGVHPEEVAEVVRQPVRGVDAPRRPRPPRPRAGHAAVPVRRGGRQ